MWRMDNAWMHFANWCWMSHGVKSPCMRAQSFSKCIATPKAVMADSPCLVRLQMQCPSPSGPSSWTELREECSEEPTQHCSDKPRMLMKLTLQRQRGDLDVHERRACAEWMRQTKQHSGGTVPMLCDQHGQVHNRMWHTPFRCAFHLAI